MFFCKPKTGLDLYSINLQKQLKQLKKELHTEKCAFYYIILSTLSICNSSRYNPDEDYDCRLAAAKKIALLEAQIQALEKSIKEYHTEKFTHNSPRLN